MLRTTTFIHYTNVLIFYIASYIENLNEYSQVIKRARSFIYSYVFLLVTAHIRPILCKPSVAFNQPLRPHYICTKYKIHILLQLIIKLVQLSFWQKYILLIVLTIHSVYSIHVSTQGRYIFVVQARAIYSVPYLFLWRKKKLDMSLSDFDIWNLNTSQSSTKNNTQLIFHST